METFKVLHINAGSVNFGGVSALCLNLYRNIDRERFQFDFLTPNRTTYGEYREEIEAMGGHIYQFGIDANTISGKRALKRKLKEFFRDHWYDVVHVNSGILLFNCVAADAARKYSGAKVFVHSHSNGGRNRLKECFSFILKHYLVCRADELLACSESAARYMFPAKAAEKAVIINNGIDAQRFVYRPEVRERIRREYGLEDRYVIGHIGRFSPKKNQEFLINLLPLIQQKKKNAVLLLVGQGELMEKAKNRAAEAGLFDSVLFLGQRKNTEDFYQAMDVFALPSTHEGFGIVNIEAQTSGLKCVVSDAVPDAANVSGLMTKLPLTAPEEKWVSEILTPPLTRESRLDAVVEAGYDIRSSAKALEDAYMKHEKRCK